MKIKVHNKRFKMKSYSTQIICIVCGNKALAGSSSAKYCFECRDKIRQQKNNKKELESDIILEMTALDIIKKNKGIIYVIGNGGSSAEADHMASEFLTHGIPSIPLTNSSVITALANDYSYSEVFSKQIEVLGRKNDILIGLSTSGKSKNILKAYETAKKKGIKVIDWPRHKVAKTMEDVAQIQEYQLSLMHKIYLELC